MRREIVAGRASRFTSPAGWFGDFGNGAGRTFPRGAGGQFDGIGSDEDKAKGCRGSHQDRAADQRHDDAHQCAMQQETIFERTADPDGGQESTDRAADRSEKVARPLGELLVVFLGQVGSAQVTL